MPRPAPTPHDDTALTFLGLAAEFIDASLAPAGIPVPRRLRSFRFPVTLEWLRADDVIRLAEESGKPGLSRKAFFNRWRTKDEFVKDAVIYALLYRDRPIEQVLSPNQLDRMPRVGSLSEEIIRIADPYIQRLLQDPRSFLMLHIGPLLEHHPSVRAAVMSSIRGTTAWFEGYGRLLADLGLVFRPGWTVERFGWAIQCILEGFLFRYRIQPEDYVPTRWQGASLFADAVIAFALGVIDAERSGLSARQALDAAVARR